MSFDLDGYVDVAERIGIFRDKYPEGSLQPVNPERPFTIETIGDRVFIVYAAAAYRNPDDHLPGIGVAWEPFPGPTPYTKDSELMNAETSAWGRAIVAALAADTKKIASAQEVRNRRGPDSANTAPAERGGGAEYPPASPSPSSPRLASGKQLFALGQLIEVHGPPDGCPWPLPTKDDPERMSMRAASGYIDALKKLPEPPPNVRVATLRVDSGEPDHPGGDAAESPTLTGADTFSDTYDLADYSPDPF